MVATMYLANAEEISEEEAIRAELEPLVSVVIPVYNAARFIERSIVSVIEQTYRPLEIIVVDDCSSDGTGEYVTSLGHPLVTLVRLEVNSGAAHARNVGIKLARGKYIALLDADDRWLPDKLSRQVAFLESDPTLVLVGCNFVYVRDGMPGSRLFDRALPPSDNKDAWKTLLKYPFISTPCAVFRRDMLEKIEPFDEKLVIAEDQDLWIRLALAGKVGVIHETLVEVHDIAGSLNKRELMREMDCLLPMVERHVKAQRHLLTWRETREILGRRNFNIGANVYQAGYLGACLPYFTKSLWYGYKPIRSLLVFAKVPIIWLRKKLVKTFGKPESSE
jgi:glycosyltransferase involved in cell wall biosynthesis